MLGCALPIRRPTTPASVNADPWFTSGGQERREQVDLHPLADPRGFAVAQGGEDPDRGEEPGHHVDERHPDLLRLALGVARDAHEPADRLHEQVVARQRRARPGAEPVMEQKTSPGLSPQVPVAQPEAVHDARAEVLHHHVGLRASARSAATSAGSRRSATTLALLRLTAWK
jgi:hypothetical protein